MLILLTVLIMFLTAFTLMIYQWTRQDFRFAWLIATGGTFLAWLSVFLWLLRLPIMFSLPVWQPRSLFINSPVFAADSLSWPYALSLTTLALATMLTATARVVFPNPITWSGILILTGLGLLAISADNPLTLVLVWAAIDLTELINQLRAVSGPKLNESVVISFSTRAIGLGILLWAGMVSIASGTPLNFISTPPQAGLYLLVAASLRLGVLPLHLPFTAESTLRRGFGTVLRLVSATSSLILLARIPSNSLSTPLTSLLMILTGVAALYGGWMWLSASDALNGRPFLLIGLASLAVASTLRANPAGSVAWGCAMILAGGALFLTSIQGKWLTRILLAGTWGLSALPLSPTAAGWLSGTSTPWVFWLLFIPAQALLLSGYVRHALRPAESSFASQPQWAKTVYPVGIALLPLAHFLIGIWGWAGALKLGVWWISLISILLAASLTWTIPRLPLIYPGRLQRPLPITTSWLNRLYRILWGLYQLLSRLSFTIAQTLEGDGGILWTMLLLVLIISLLGQGAR